MELLEGLTLRDELDRRGGRATPAEVAAWFGPICTAVAAAHEAGVVHRDLKPENVFLTRAGQIKVLDFGLARFVEPDEGSSVTMPGLIMGTLGYIAPELLLGREADAQSDVYSLGVMAFEALTGDLPFAGRTLSEVATSIFIDEAHLSGEDPGVWALDHAMQRCLVNDRRKRYASVAEMSRVLVPALARCPPAIR
jgi:serine/threonine-protein kinase